MNAAGIIAEYNPFHNGHRYQLDTLREQTGADYIVIAMSGNFVQRGVPAFFDKYERAKAALCCGADLVLEIPTIWATASAEYFASAGVALLGCTGVVRHLGYGVEAHDPALMAELTELLHDAPLEYDRRVIALQKEGHSYPLARARALASQLPRDSHGELENFLASPNNILALEYEKALALWNVSHEAPIKSHPIFRVGTGYHDDTLVGSFASATAIRKAWSEGMSAEDLSSYVPRECRKHYAALLEECRCTGEDSISSLLYYRLRMCADMGYEAFADCSPSLSHKIANRLPEYESFSQFCSLLKSRDVTYTRISRVLLHILLDIRQTDYQGENTLRPPYLRVLGFRESAADLLKSIKQCSPVPMVTKMADAESILSHRAYDLLKKDIFAADLYNHLGQSPSGYNEFTHPIVKL